MKNEKKSITDKSKSGEELSIKSGEQYLRLMSGATTKAEQKRYTKSYNEFLAKRQKEVIANEYY